MAKLKLGPVVDEKVVKVTIELPAPLHRDLSDYAQALAQETGQSAPNPEKLIIPMLQRFIETDRGFTRGRRELSRKRDRQ